METKQELTDVAYEKREFSRGSDFGSVTDEFVPGVKFRTRDSYKKMQYVFHGT